MIRGRGAAAADQFGRGVARVVGRGVYFIGAVGGGHSDEVVPQALQRVIVYQGWNLGDELGQIPGDRMARGVGGGRSYVR